MDCALPRPRYQSPTKKQPSNVKSQKTEESLPGNIWRYLVLGLVFHLIYILSIFDIYFKSPLIVGLPSIPPALGPPPARRLVIFVGDGLRADKFYGDDPKTGTARAPFIRDHIAKKKGVWGIMHARVPTESRPGHVAMMAGMWEDVSAVTKGWKRNPVEYDHIFRQANRAWIMGAGDILDLFPGPNVSAFTFSDRLNDFARDPREMDRWTFDRAQKLLTEDAQKDQQLDAQLREEGVIFFLHLLGLDSNGHANGPHSPQYADNIRLVDEGVNKFTKLMDDFYQNDGKTAYIFVSDHGMGDNWVHGDGHPDNTRCPLVVWGAGIDNPRPLLDGEVDPLMEMDSYYQEKDGISLQPMIGLKRRDIEQTDLAPLMATLLGVPIPTNSVGTLPLALFASGRERWKAQAALINAQQLLVTVKAKEENRARYEPFFRPYLYPTSDLKRELSRLELLVEEGKLEDALDALPVLLGHIHSAHHYYQTYDWLLLKVVVAVGFGSWIIYSILFLNSPPPPPPPPSSSKFGRKSKGPQFLVYSLFGTIGAICAIYLGLKRAPLLYYAYFFFPWYFLLNTTVLLFQQTFPQKAAFIPKSNWLWFIPYAVGVELLTAALFWRPIVSMAVLAVAGIFFGKVLKEYRQRDRLWTILALILGLCLAAVFPMLPPIEQPQPIIWLSGCGAVTVAVASLLLWACNTISRWEKLLRITLTAMSGLIAAISDYQRTAGLPIHSFLPMFGWLTVISMALEPWLTRRKPLALLERLVLLFSSMAPGYLILSISYEPWFLVAFVVPLIGLVAALIRWVPPSHHDHHPKSTILVRNEVILTLSYKFLVYICLSFFGTGNFASIASFSLPSVYRLITVFAPFTMTALLIGKIFVPIILFAALFGGLLRTLIKTTTSQTSVFLWLVATVDLLTINFFFLVRDTGSWMEIGTSISHFIIASAFSLMVGLMYFFSQSLLAGVDYWESIGLHKVGHKKD